jgi:hypothetical protein
MLLETQRLVVSDKTGTYSSATPGKSKYVPIDPGGEMVTPVFAPLKNQPAIRVVILVPDTSSLAYRVETDSSLMGAHALLMEPTNRETLVASRQLASPYIRTLHRFTSSVQVD